MEHKHDLPTGLNHSYQQLNQQQQQIAQVLIDIGQAHIFQDWTDNNDDLADKQKLLNQAILLDEQYVGGLDAYVRNSQLLLENSRLGLNPFEGYTPSVPQGQRLESGTAEFDEAEEIGLDASGRTGFVLVAGGLGERLGFQGIKVALPIETITGQCYLEYYIDYILEFQRRGRLMTGNNDLILPLAIMTSGDTHEATVELLASNNNFGMAEDQITIVKQEKVPAIMDNDGKFALNNPYEISTKPHGHGDVHSLLAQYGVISKWVEMGIDWVVFFQDTNGLVFRALLAALGVSVRNEFEVNSLTVPRRPGEAVGGICTLTKEDGSCLTVNVEYNQLDPLLRATISPDGDIPDESGYSPYPGNINVLIFAAGPYAQVLAETGGAVPEFVNPKYADAEKTIFKKPTRLECMMQDYPKLLGPEAKVGFTQVERWMSFSAVKNNINDAQVKLEKTGFAESAASGEDDYYSMNLHLLQLSGNVEVQDVEEKSVYSGIPVSVPARVIITPSFGLTQREIAEKLADSHIHLSSNSVLSLKGSDIKIHDLSVSGALFLEAIDGSSVEIIDMNVDNSGVAFNEIDINDENIPQEYRIRGYMAEIQEAEFVRSMSGDKLVVPNAE